MVVMWVILRGGVFSECPVPCQSHLLAWLCYASCLEHGSLSCQHASQEGPYNGIRCPDPDLNEPREKVDKSYTARRDCNVQDEGIAAALRIEWCRYTGDCDEIIAKRIRVC
jgi:hypothetical protein